MATKKSKSSARSSSKARTASSKAASKSVEKTEVVTKTTKKHCLSGFFARKYEEKESINTVFKSPKFYGALLGEMVGTMLLGLMIFAIWPLGNGNLIYIASYLFALIAILVAVVAISGACLNPIVTVGMMASRRMSVVRGVMYIIAEVVGVWLAWLIFNACHASAGENAMAESAALTAIADGGFWTVALIEFLGAAILGFFFARAQEYKRSAFTFATVVAGGLVLAILVGYVISAAYFNLSANFVLNPAVALMMQIFPTSGGNFGEILGGICQALSAYVLLPMIGGVIGFYISDFAKKLTED